MSKRVKFSQDFDFVVSAQALVSYKAGQELAVPDPHAEAAIAAGRAQEVTGATPAPKTPDPAAK